MTVWRMLSWDSSGPADRQGGWQALRVTRTLQGLTVVFTDATAVALTKRMPL